MYNMNNKILTSGIITLVAVALVIFISGCVKQPTTPTGDDNAWTQEGINAVVNANNQFTFEIYSELNKNERGNIFLSPYSISSALAMTYEGAEGKTAEEMQDVFHFPEEDIRQPNSARIYNQLNERNKDYELHTANALWAQQDYRFLDEYSNTTERYYGGGVTNLDFVGETEKSRQIINGWVEDQTNDKIKDLIPPGQLNPMTRLVLTNAIYFKGTWVYQFDKKDTREMDFKITPDNIIKVPMMHLDNDDARFNYAETEELQILELPYRGEEISMLILLPKEDIASLEKELDAEQLAEYKNILTKQGVVICLPKFTFETKYKLNDQLIEMGMPTAFTWPGADFSGMTGNNDLFISFVIHQAFVDVNEEGTEAAAATAVGMELGAMPTNIFCADHPFIFIIQQKDTGNILFLGRVIDPTK
ncbi:MAG: serpin family protein [Candidatus Altiarchaeota archaeon]|nr:serpin family protein [Candidatus Altiarchaeota archaeon]